MRPIFKKWDKTCSGNYRPFSLTSVVCKLFEGLIRDGSCDHLNQNKLLSDCQFGFSKGRSCVTQLLITINDWMTELDDSIPVDAVYLDVRKAFDTVPHKRLIIKLKGYGITGNILEWIQDFLSRRQYVNINDANQNVNINDANQNRVKYLVVYPREVSWGLPCLFTT